MNHVWKEIGEAIRFLLVVILCLMLGPVGILVFFALVTWEDR